MSRIGANDRVSKALASGFSRRQNDGPKKVAIWIFQTTTQR